MKITKVAGSQRWDRRYDQFLTTKRTLSLNINYSVNSTGNKDNGVCKGGIQSIRRTSTKFIEASSLKPKLGSITAACEAAQIPNAATVLNRNHI